MREHLADESVDLVYLDPPFNSAHDHHVFGPKELLENKEFDFPRGWSLRSGGGGCDERIVQVMEYVARYTFDI